MSFPALWISSQSNWRFCRKLRYDPLLLHPQKVAFQSIERGRLSSYTSFTENSLMACVLDHTDLVISLLKQVFVFNFTFFSALLSRASANLISHHSLFVNFPGTGRCLMYFAQMKCRLISPTQRRDGHCFCFDLNKASAVIRFQVRPLLAVC